MEEATLPNELIVEVLRWCDRVTVATTGQSCREMHGITKSDALLLARVDRFQPKLFNAVKRKSIAARFRALKAEHRRLLENIDVWAPGFVVEDSGVGPVYSPSDDYGDFAFSNGTRIYAMHPKDVTPLWHNAICRVALGPTVLMDVATRRPDAWSKVPLAIAQIASETEIVKRAEGRFTALKEAGGAMIVEDASATVAMTIRHARNYSTSCVMPSPVYGRKAEHHMELFEAIVVLPECRSEHIKSVMHSWVQKAGRPKAAERAAQDEWYLAWSDRRQNDDDDVTRSPWVECGFDPDATSASLLNLVAINNNNTKERIRNYAMMFHCHRPGVLTIVPLQQKIHELLFLV